MYLSEKLTPRMHQTGMKYIGGILNLILALMEGKKKEEKKNEAK